ncbi:MAG: hypothetical protein RL662_2139 [Bacteroidota bacterium]|jgi:hypothetical protein
MEFRKKISVVKSELTIDHQTRLQLFGSCFAQNMGMQLIESKFNVSVNPFGVLYNPASIAQAIHILLEERIFDQHDVFKDQGVYHTFFHHSSFSNTDLSSFINQINNEREQATEQLKQADLLLITFGTSYVFSNKASQQIVANCHKLPASTFDRYRLSVANIVEVWDKLIARLKEINPSLQILFTVSPIRHWKDGAHNNQLSKATLLLAIDELIYKHTSLHYFPSYEIVLDELRDYRFYAEDMLHPNDLAIRYIWSVFSETYFNAETVQITKQWTTIYKALMHRPFNEKTEEHKQFLRQTLLKIKDLQNKYPYFDCCNEVQLLSDRLS